MRAAGIGLILLFGWGCDLIGPSCLSRQKTGTVTSVSGEVAAGAIVSHQVPYATEGSQNDGHLSWERQSTADGPRIRFYATRVDCTDFQPPPAANGAACFPLSTAGWFDGHIAATLTVTNGRGNPDVLGAAAEYKIWIVGDPAQSARYAINITWFYGPDC